MCLDVFNGLGEVDATSWIKSRDGSGVGTGRAVECARKSRGTVHAQLVPICTTCGNGVGGETGAA